MKYTLFLALVISCASPKASNSAPDNTSKPIVGAERTSEYLPLLSGKNVAIVANNTSRIHQTHLVDSLISLGINVKKVFAPEHGFRGDHGAGETVKSDIDAKTGLLLISLYGKNKKPSPESLKGIDIVVFDIQDVGARFYTYISTMHYVMEACAELSIPVIVLDRPNPNGHYIDGPVLDLKYQSFVGMHPIPIVHGCTVGELAKMINGENWLKNSIHCNLTVIPCTGYDHNTNYDLPYMPSPNLPNAASIYAYPSLCLFEGTAISVGRGTEFPFQWFGFPGFKSGTKELKPKDIPGVVTDPPFENQNCNGVLLENKNLSDFRSNKQLNLDWILLAFKEYDGPSPFFKSPDFFDKLAGNEQLRKQIIEGKTPEEIRSTWKLDLAKYQALRSKYLLYSDFE
jgi:uncharacterized protein YbbC (DUF1343 family)